MERPRSLMDKHLSSKKASCEFDPHRGHKRDILFVYFFFVYILKQMRTKNAKELASIVTLLMSSDYESVMLGISLFSNHYLITNYPKYKKFKISIKYPGRNPPPYCATVRRDNKKEFNKNQFLRMLASKSVDIKIKTCAIINFIEQNVELIELENGKKNYNRNSSLAYKLWGTALDKLSVEEIESCVNHTEKTTSEPFSKKKKRALAYKSYENNWYPDFYEGVFDDIKDDYKDAGLSNKNPSLIPYKTILGYKRYLALRFSSKYKNRCVCSDIRVSPIIDLVYDILDTSTSIQNKVYNYSF